MTKTETINVTGMTCTHCKNSVMRILKEVKGVSQADVSLENKEVTITYDDGQVSRQQLLDAVNETGTFQAS